MKNENMLEQVKILNELQVTEECLVSGVGMMVILLMASRDINKLI